MTSNILIIYRLHNQYKIIWPIRTFPHCSLWEHLVVHSRAIKHFLFALSKCHLETNMNFSLFTISYHFQVSHDNDKARIMHLRMDWGCGPNAPISYLYLLSLIFLIPCVQYILSQSAVSTKLMSFWVLCHSWWVVRTTKPCDKSWLNKCFVQISSSHLAVISIIFPFSCTCAYPSAHNHPLKSVHFTGFPLPCHPVVRGHGLIYFAFMHKQFRKWFTLLYKER